MKSFDPTKGHGFTKPDDDGADVFVRISAVGYTTLVEAARRTLLSNLS